MAVKKRRQHRKEGLLYRYANLHRDLHSKRLSVRNRAQHLLTVTICVPLIAVSCIYIIHWNNVKTKIVKDNKEYSELYEPAAQQTAVPVNTIETTAAAEINETEAPVETARPTPTPESTQMLQTTEEAILEETDTPTNEPTDTPAPQSVQTAESEQTDEAVAEDELLIVNSTPNADTVIYAIETAPPVQDSFKSLIETNSETVGYLTVGSQISLPVVQRVNDNEYYLTHNLRGEESEGGTLFLDGSNLLVPEDPVLLIYGHNMKNGTMFQPLTCYERPDYLRANPIVQFDTIYENKRYTPVAVFSESVDPDSEGYVDIRQFSFDETEWELFILKMEKLSIYDMDIDAQYGDHLLLLVTCEYSHDNGRLIVVLRELHSDETEESLRQKLANVSLK